MTEIEAAAVWLEEQAEATKSGPGLQVSAAEADFARQRLRACANGLRAGLHLPDQAGGQADA
jgi:hypothetical protein